LPIPDTPLLRIGLIRSLQLADYFLRNDPSVREALGQNVRLKLADTFRAYEVQKYAYEVYWPKALKNNHPDWTEEQILEYLPKCCAKPKDYPTPTPHQTGGAVDIQLWGLDGKRIDLGYKKEIKDSAFPDAYESSNNAILELLDSETIRQIKIARRVLSFAMEEVGGMTVNPYEIWHFDLGNPLWGYVTEERPYYGLPSIPDWYKIG